MSTFMESFWGSVGFEELRRYIKQGGDACKEIANVLQERSEMEAMYAKGLGKLASKTARIARDSVGTLAQAYQALASELEAEGELHKSLALNLIEEIVKPLKVLIDAQHKVRKAVESNVDKFSRVLNDLRTAETKAKKHCYGSARDNERAQDQLLEAKMGRGKIVSEKDTAKLEGKKRKTEEVVRKADYDYYSTCVSAERSRLEWESTVIKGCSKFQTLEEERLTHMHEVLKKYNTNWSAVAPHMMQSTHRFTEAVNCIDVTLDIQTAISHKGINKCTSEQILPNFYAEDLSNVINKERRKEGLEKLLLLIKHDIEKERRGKQGVENLAKVFQETPTFGDQDAQNDVQEKLQHMRSMLAYFEATRFKIMCCLADIEGHTRPLHPLSRHMEQHKDKQGQVQTILKVPSWVRGERWNSVNENSSFEIVDGMLDRGSADGNSHSPDNCDDFSVSSHDGSSYNGPTSRVSRDMKRNLSLCKALYDYEANMYDELTIHLGDVITVYEKLDDGWWHGELNGEVGIFPAAYVEEIN
ncbi:hypothetical protein CHUAL_007426 [Chamberlinius hualienensis]